MVVLSIYELDSLPRKVPCKRNSHKTKTMLAYRARRVLLFSSFDLKLRFPNAELKTA